VCARVAAGPDRAGPGSSHTRVSTGEQADSGAGLAAQESQLRAEAERRGWVVVGLLSDAGASGSSMRKRPELADALALVDRGQGDVLAVAKLDRLSRSVLDFAQLMVRARDLGWGLVALDLGVDTTTTSGRLVANVMVSVTEWERDIIGQRTREGLAERRGAGVRLGGPQMVPAPIVARIVGGRRRLHRPWHRRGPDCRGGADRSRRRHGLRQAAGPAQHRLLVLMSELAGSSAPTGGPKAKASKARVAVDG